MKKPSRRILRGTRWSYFQRSASRARGSAGLLYSIPPLATRPAVPASAPGSMDAIDDPRARLPWMVARRKMPRLQSRNRQWRGVVLRDYPRSPHRQQAPFPAHGVFRLGNMLLQAGDEMRWESGAIDSRQCSSRNARPPSSARPIPGAPAPADVRSRKRWRRIPHDIF